MLGENPGINNTKHFVAFFSSSQKSRSQQRIIYTENIPGEKNRERILNSKFLFKRLHRKLPNLMIILMNKVCFISKTPANPYHIFNISKD
jgi:hypothetical protein